MTVESQAGFHEPFALRTVVEAILKLRVWVAFTVTALAFYSNGVLFAEGAAPEPMAALEPGAARTPWAVWAVIFLSTLALYNLDGCLEGSSPRQEGTPSRRIQLTTSLLAIAAISMLLPVLSQPGTALVVIGLLVCSLYALPLGFRRSMRRPLKSIPGIKAPFVGFSVAVATVWVPLLSRHANVSSGPAVIGGSLFWSAVALTITLGLLCTVNALLFDVPDIREDQAKGVPTLVVRWGIASNRLLCVFICLFAAGGSVLALTRPFPVVLLACALTFAALLINRETHKTTVAFWVDGALTLPALATLLDT